MNRHDPGDPPFVPDHRGDDLGSQAAVDRPHAVERRVVERGRAVVLDDLASCCYLERDRLSAQVDRVLLAE